MWLNLRLNHPGHPVCDAWTTRTSGGVHARLRLRRWCDSERKAARPMDIAVHLTAHNLDRPACAAATGLWATCLREWTRRQEGERREEREDEGRESEETENALAPINHLCFSFFSSSFSVSFSFSSCAFSVFFFVPFPFLFPFPFSFFFSFSLSFFSLSFSFSFSSSFFVSFSFSSSSSSSSSFSSSRLSLTSSSSSLLLIADSTIGEMSIYRIWRATFSDHVSGGE